MTTRVLVVDHHDSYTWNLVHLIASVTGTLPEVVQHDSVGTLDTALSRLLDQRGSTHIVLSPGPGHPANPADFALGRSVFELGVPVLGVCLGLQAMVVEYGGTVAQIEPAHGDVARITHDGSGIFAGIPDGFDAVRYHSLAAVEVPSVLRVTATSDEVVMGVVHRELPLHAVQFHPESILSEHGAELVTNFLELS